MKHLLFVCFAAQDRSPAACSLFVNSKEYKTKYSGISPMADIILTIESLKWADEIFVMNPEQKRYILEHFYKEIKDKPEIKILDIPNNFCRNDPQLMEMLKNKLEEYL